MRDKVIDDMEGKEKHSVSNWRKIQKEKKNASKKEYYRKNQEKLAGKARERMKRLREDRKQVRGLVGVATRGSEKGTHEKRAAQVRTKRIAKEREEQREELRKEQKRRQTRERVRKFHEKRKLANDANPESEVDCATPAFSSRMAKKRAKDKVTPTLPKTPTKKAEVVKTLADSPSTRKVLEK